MSRLRGGGPKRPADADGRAGQGTLTADAGLAAISELCGRLGSFRRWTRPSARSSCGTGVSAWRGGLLQRSGSVEAGLAARYSSVRHQGMSRV